MLLKTVTGVTSISEIILKGVSTIIFNSSAALSGNERISLYKESKDGSLYQCNDMALKDVLHLASFQDESKLKMYGYTGVTYAIELTSDGGYVPVETGEQYRYKLTGLTAGTTYNISGLEAPFESQNLFFYEEVVFPVGQKIMPFNTDKYDLLGLDQVTDITDVSLRWSNGATTRLTADEFNALSSSLDDELYNNPPTASNISVIPLGGYHDDLSVVSIEVSKPSANGVTVLFRRDANNPKTV